MGDLRLAENIISLADTRSPLPFNMRNFADQSISYLSLFFFFLLVFFLAILASAKYLMSAIFVRFFIVYSKVHRIWCHDHTTLRVREELCSLPFAHDYYGST